MRFSHVIKAPGVVQLYRIGFAACAGCFIAFVLRWRFIGNFDGLLVLDAFALCGLLGFVSTFIRAPQSRWMLATMGVLIPAGVFTGMCLIECSRPTAWWDWVLSALVAVAIWFAVPIGLAVTLFKDRKANEYFTRSKA